MFCNLKNESRVSHPEYVGLLLLRQVRRPCSKALTLIELLLAICILGTLAAVAVPVYTNYIDKARSADAGAVVRDIELKIATFQAENGRLPVTLAEAGVINNSDPWGNPYRYVRIQGVPEPPPPNKWRKYHGEVPINSDFDLYSMGKDGESNAPLTASASLDDIVRANDGTYVGLASEF